MESPARCTTCNGVLTAGRCLHCEQQWRYRFVDREIIILTTLVAVTIAVFFATRRFAADNDVMRRQDAEAWYAIGDAALQKGDLPSAVPAFRRAAAKDPDDARYRRSLATALMANHDDDAALQLLLDLRDEQADDAETHLQLARLEARRGDETSAGRYYQTAIVALWQAAQAPARQQVLTEFVQFLLKHGERDRALSELLVLEAGLTGDVPSQVSAATMLLAAGDPRRALDHFQSALQREPTDAKALAGAGEAAFDLSDYARARRYFNRISTDTDRTRDLRALTELVLGDDALAPRLPIAERRRRLGTALTRVVERLQACEARAPADRLDAGVDVSATLTQAVALDKTLESRRGLRSSDEVEAAFDVVYRGTREADRACGSPEPLDRALLLIGRRHGLEDQ